MELWKTNGTTGGTELVKNIQDRTDGGNTIGGLTEFQGEVYFASTKNAATGKELWVTDGTNGGTMLVEHLNPTGPDRLSGLAVFDGELFLSAHDGCKSTMLLQMAMA